MVVYRVKDTKTNTYWKSNGFAKTGLIYSTYARAERVIKNMSENKDFYFAGRNLIVVKATLLDET